MSNMKCQNSAIIIGWINKGKPADCGETMKNQLMIQKLEELGVKCYPADFKNWRKHPWVFLQLLWLMLTHRNATLIFPTSVQNVYPMMKLMRNIKWKQHTVHWVIGGSLGENVKNGLYSPEVIGYMDCTIVESPIMQAQLEACGVKRVITLPNFKPITYYPDIKERIATVGKRPLRFVFLSRIIAEKGCDYIMECAKQLNEMGLEHRYIIDFYGAIGKTYETVFNEKIRVLDNINYKGFLNLREKEGYDRLADYDVMLFPTYWKGEGFAGVFIDAFVSGLPMIASDWRHNRQFMKENETALFVPVHNIPVLRDKMRECIEGKHDLGHMALCCQKHAEIYHIDNVITEQLLERTGIIKECKKWQN